MEYRLQWHSICPISNENHSTINSVTLETHAIKSHSPTAKVLPMSPQYVYGDKATCNVNIQVHSDSRVKICLTVCAALNLISLHYSENK
jgi:hypothetical protein